MSGPIFTPAGASDGVAWAVREDLAAPMRTPPDPHANALTPPDYWTGAVPYYGDYQLTPVGSPSSLALVFEFSKPIQQFRTTAQFVPSSGFHMHAVATEADFVGGGAFAAAATVAWEPDTSGTRTLVYAPGFRFVVLTSAPVSSPLLGILAFGPTFRNTTFEEVIVAAEPIVVIEPDQRVPRGAGRIISFTWPDTSWPGNPNPQAIVPRPRVAGTQTMVVTNIAPVPAGGGVVNYKGQRANVLTGQNGHGTIEAPLVGVGRPMTMYPALERPLSADLTGLDEIACYRLTGMLAFDQPAGPVAWDCGLVIGVGASNKIRNGTNPGMSLGLIDIGTIALTTRQVEGGAAVVTPLALPVGFDVTQWHKYELRIISATPVADAVLRVLVDDSEVLVLTWAAIGSVLPLPFTGAPTQWGYGWCVINLGGTVDFIAKLYVAAGGVQYHVAMTEDALQ